MKYLIDEETLSGLANALRSVTGETRSYTPTEMIDAVTNIMETGTYILVDENGYEVPAVFVDNETRFTATANDIRIGTTAVTDSGVTVGEKEIPSYNTTEGYAVVPAGSNVRMTGVSIYDYTKLQALICSFNSSVSNSVATEKVCIDNSVYAAGSTISLAEVTTNKEDRSIDFGILNESGNLQIIRYFTYKEIY